MSQVMVGTPPASSPAQQASFVTFERPHSLITAQRTHAVQPFHVMEFMKRADALAAAGRDILHVSVGEPDFGAPPLVQHALTAALSRGDTGYTPALGIFPLRQAIAQYYVDRFGVTIDPS